MSFLALQLRCQCTKVPDQSKDAGAPSKESTALCISTQKIGEENRKNRKSDLSQKSLRKYGKTSSNRHSNCTSANKPKMVMLLLMLVN